MDRDGEYDAMVADHFYRTSRWERTRLRILRRDGYQCQVSKRYGKLVQANTVHHIFPRHEFPKYAWCEWNLVSLSHTAHNALHVRQSDDLTDAGKDLLRRTAKRQGIPLPEKYK